MSSHSPLRGAARLVTPLLAAATLALLAPATAGAARRAPGPLAAVGSTNFYADVIAQVGGPRVLVTGIISNPNADPHSYESSTSDAAAVADARLVVQNGAGYDDFMGRLEHASPSSRRTVIDVAQALGVHTGENPHLWYDPRTMPRVAHLVARALEAADPAHRSGYETRLRRFLGTLAPWTRGLAALRARVTGIPVAVTEPIFGYSAAVLGLRVLTPRSFQLAIEEGNDPAPQDVQAAQDLLSKRRVRVLLYDTQAREPVTDQLRDTAHSHRVPVVGITETMPPGTHYAAWMLAQLRALDAALAHGVSDA